MKFDEAVSIAHTLSSPSKMPWYGYSIPASTCQIGARFAKVKGTICSICYAAKGRYLFSNVQEAMFKRFNSLTHPLWVDAMVAQLLHKAKSYKKGVPHFRWHDSGDIQSVEHLRKIVAVAERTPNIRHWLPTREVPYVKQYLKEVGPFPENLTVRISASRIGHKARPVEGLPISTVGVVEESENFVQCMAPRQGGECRDCRACWGMKDVNYKPH